MNRLLILIIALLWVMACNPNREKNPQKTKKGGAAFTKNEAVAPEQPFQKQIRLEYGFAIKAGGYEKLGHLETYTLLVVTRGGKEVFKDSSLTEYAFSNKRYPKVIPTGQDAFELLLEVNNRPDSDYLRWIRIERNEWRRTGQLPLFIAEAANRDEDKALEWVGYWGEGQVWGENHQLTAYNPILYYEQLPGGLRLDSTLTRTKNKAIYGEFHGFSFREDIPVPAALMDKFDQEVRRIKGGTL